MAKHLTDMQEFVESFATFDKLLKTHNVTLADEENVCRLFDMWLSNYKDERVLEEQFKKDPWEESD
jgi:hypothetical protein